MMLNVQPVFGAQLNIFMNNNELVSFPGQNPYIDSKGKILVPIRFISQELGGSIKWDTSSNQITIYYKGDKIRLTVGSPQAVITRGTFVKQINMGTAAVLKSGRVMVPLRFITESMGFSMKWVESAQTVFIEKVIPKLPDQELLGVFKSLDAEFIKQIANKDGYQGIKSWNDGEATRTSSGAFTDYVAEIRANKLGDTLFFEYDAKGNKDIAWVSIYFATDKDQNEFFYYDMSQDVIHNKSHIIINRDQFQAGKGSPTWDKVKYFRVAFESKPGTRFTLSPKNLATYNGGHAIVTLWFDDGWEDAYTNAYRIASEIDPSIRGVVPIIPSAIDTDRYLSKKQLGLLRKGGWEIVNHSYSHLYLTELSDDKVKDEVQKAFSFISDYDPEGAYHFTVPFSSANEKILDILKENALSVRYLGGTVDSVPFDRFNLGYKEVTNDTTFETVKEWIDEAIKNKKWLGLMFHRIEDPANDRYSYGTQEFKKIVYYLSLMKSDIRTVTVTEAFDEAGMPISIKTK
jgi:peptidoglycan/xylan/chitin deacetylase (PgdA/CDA1 family)